MKTYARETDDGGAEIGVVVDGAYVPLASAAGYRVDQLKERAEQLGDVEKQASGTRSSSRKKATDDDAGKEG